MEASVSFVRETSRGVADVANRNDQAGKQRANWQQRWESWHPEPDQFGTRRSTINDLLDYLTTNQGYLSEIRVSMSRGSLSVGVDSEDPRGSSWYIRDGILPTEYESIRNLLSENDDEAIGMVKEDLVGATLATVLHLRGVRNPIDAVRHMQERYCLASCLESISTNPARAGRDTWDTFAEAVQSDSDAFVRKARFDAQFPPEGPSGETIASLRKRDWPWSKIMKYAESHGYKGTERALCARVDRFWHDAKRKERKLQAWQESMQLGDPSETLEYRIANAKPRLMKSGGAAEALADRIDEYLRGRMNEPGINKSPSAELIAVSLGEDPAKVLRALEANPNRFIRDRDGGWTLKNPA